jgi:hypothetical protein
MGILFTMALGIQLTISNLPVIVSLKQTSNLLVAERLVQLFGHGITSLFIRTLNHSRTPPVHF